MRKIVSLFVLGCLLSVCFTYAQTGIPRPEYPRPQFERNTWINLISIPHMMGHCYTQLTDVEQEQNGIYNYDRTAKFDMKRIKAILSKTPQRK